MVRDMTEGKPLGLIFRFCIPLLLGNLFQQFYSMVDSVVVGQFVGKQALAAVGATGSFSFLVIGFAMGMCSGLCIPVAQYFGAGDYKNLRAALMQAVYITAAVTLLLTAAMLFLTRPMLTLIQTPADIFEQSYSYISIIFIGIAPTMLYNLPAGVLRSLGDSKTPLLYLVIASILNVVLDILFVVYFHMGVAGAAWATVISQTVSGALCVRHMFKHFPILRLERKDLAFNPEIARKGVSIGLPMGLQYSLTAIGSVVLQSAINSLGSDAVAAVTAASKVQSIVSQPMETMGASMATYCGQNLGAKKPARIKQGIIQASIANMLIGVAGCILILLVGDKIALLFIKPEEVDLLSNIRQYLAICSYFYPILSLIFTLRYSLQGLGFSAQAMTAGLFELVARSAVAFLLVGTLGFYAVCLSNPIAWIAADILLIPLAIVKIRELNATMKEETT